MSILKVLPDLNQLMSIFKLNKVFRYSNVNNQFKLKFYIIYEIPSEPVPCVATLNNQTSCVKKMLFETKLKNDQEVI